MATDEIKKGDAVIRCCVEGKVKEYKIRITKTDKHTKEENKGLEIKVTDPELLEITGGIIQGMYRGTNPSERENRWCSHPCIRQ